MSSELYLTEYERERQKKIEENKRLLETLGILETRSVLDASAVVCCLSFCKIVPEFPVLFTLNISERTKG
jgi:hypothetical protein